MRRTIAMGLIMLVIMSVAGFAQPFKFSGTTRFSDLNMHSSGTYSRNSLYSGLSAHKDFRTSRLISLRNPQYNRYPNLVGFNTRFGGTRNTFSRPHYLGYNRYNVGASGIYFGRSHLGRYAYSRSRFSHGVRLR